MNNNSTNKIGKKRVAFIMAALVISAAAVLAYLWFLGLNPDDKLPEASLLAKFRTQR